MLAYILALVVAMGSFTFYIAAFFVPEWHRRQDFFWSGLGLFYAVVLWFCAGRLTGAVLLGQVVSVALLGGLGWHTLTLRRDLTPEPVRTPVSWADLRQWLQSLQTWAAQSLPLKTGADRLKALGSSLQQAIAQLRERSPQAGGADAAADIPPLKRSPAYEFETAAGDGQTVPSEFASVSQREQPSRTAERPVSAAPPASDDERAAQTPTSESLAPPPQPAPETEPAAAPLSASPEPGEKPEPAPEPPPVTAKEPPSSPPAPRPTPAPDPVVPAPPQNPLGGAFSRLGRLVKGGQPPKPARGVVEIPPRAPSIPRSPDTAAPPASASQTAPAKPQPANRRASKPARGVIDIPPRPPSIPRSPTSPQQPTSQDAAAAAPRSQNTDTNWDEAETNWVDSGEGTPKPAADTQPPSPPPAPPTSQPPAADTNWPTAETNWSVADSTPPPPTDSSRDPVPAEPENDTNWPDDDDTNWPD